MNTALGLLAVALGLILERAAYRNERPTDLLMRAVGGRDADPRPIDPDPYACAPTETTDPGIGPDQDPVAPGHQGPPASGDTNTVSAPGPRRGAGVPITNRRWV